jgi:hypothetical protein
MARLTAPDGLVLAEGRTVEHRRSSVDLTAIVYVPAERVEGLAAVSWSMAGLRSIADGTEAVLELDDRTVHNVTVNNNRLQPVS